MTCDDCDLLLAAHAVGALDPDEDRQLLVHLRGCDRCQASAADYVRTADLLPLALEPVTPPSALRSRLLARVHAEVAGEERVRPRRVPLRDRLWRALPAGRGLTVTGAVAAVAAVVLAVWSFAVPHRQASQPGVLVSRACGLTPLPTACGELSYTPATRQSVLTVQGLPALPVVNSAPVGGYAVWLVPSRGNPVLGAYLQPTPDGHTWAAVLEGDASTYVAVATTHEPRLGGTAPTGPELLRLTRPVSPPS
ncbi:MAG TPA: anti-sigma factor [Candidatus Dormibacteraeota bacterium]